MARAIGKWFDPEAVGRAMESTWDNQNGEVITKEDIDIEQLATESFYDIVDIIPSQTKECLIMGTHG